MATTYTLTGDAGNLLGEVPNARKVKVWIEANVDAVVDETGNEIRVGDATATVADDGSFSFADLIATNSTGINPTAFQYRVTVEYSQARPGGTRRKWSSGWFSLTANADLADVVAEQYVPPTYITQATAQLDAHADSLEAGLSAYTTQAASSASSAATSASQAAASAASASEIALGDADAAMAGAVNNPASDTHAALSATTATLFGYPSRAAADGTDQRTTLAAEIATCVTLGLDLILPAGVVSVSMGAVPGPAGYYAGIVVPSGLRIRGRGRGLTTIKLLPNQPYDISSGDGASVIYNETLTGGDEDITLEDFTVDGNAINQTGDHNGITLVRTRGARVSRVRVKNVRGTGNFPPGETFHFDTQLGIDTTFTDCEAVSEAGQPTATGFSANNATGVHYSGCVAYGMADGMGFTHWECQSVSYSNCRAYSNGTHGFNSEESQSVTYAGCHAGGEVAVGSTPYPSAAGTSLGNTGSGFCVVGSKQVSLVGCTARKNAGSGLTVVEGVLGAEGRISGSFFTHNDRGVSCATAATVVRWYVDPATVVKENTTAQFDLPAALGGYVQGPGVEVAPTPAQGGDGVAVPNPYPWRVSIYIITGTPSLLRVNGADVATGTKTIILDPGMTITAWGTYTWLWFAL